MSDKQIWLPATETKATVDEHGNVVVWDEIVMTLKPLSSQTAGFQATHDTTADSRRNIKNA